MSEQATSPLSEAKVDSIAELMMRDPLELTRRDRDQIVKELRKAREAFEAEDSKPKERKKKDKLEPVLGKVDLEDLGL